MRTLFVTASLEYSGQAKQLSSLVTHLPKNQFETRVCVLGREGPLGHVLRNAGVCVDALEWTRPLDARPLLRLRHLVNESLPDLIHAWGFAALRACATVSRGVRLAFAAPSIPRSHRWRPHPFDRWLLRRADLITLGDQHSFAAYSQLRGNDDRLRFIGRSVTVNSPSPPRRDLLRAINLPHDARIIVCVGPLEAQKGHRDAIWALDILKYLYDDLFLVLVGDGRERSRLEEFARSIRVTDRVRFAGVQPDVQPWLELAEVVWVPSLTSGGATVALEGMAAARPVVAARVPAVAETIVDGVTGSLFMPGDKVALSRLTRVLLQDEELRIKFGQAGRQRVIDAFAIGNVVGRCGEAHMRLCA